MQGVTAFVGLILLGLELGVEGADFGASGLSSLRFSDRSKNGCLDGDPGWDVAGGMSEAFPTIHHNPDGMLPIVQASVVLEFKSPNQTH